jgi:hypothetical protein
VAIFFPSVELVGADRGGGTIRRRRLARSASL